MEQALVEIIAANVSSIEDVSFDKTGEGSLCVQIARKWKTSCNKKLRTKLRRMWQNQDLQDLVEAALKSKSHIDRTDEHNLNPSTSTHYATNNVEHFKIVQIEGDGNCLFRCLAHAVFGNQNSFTQVRDEIVRYVVDNWNDNKELLDATSEEFEYETADHYASHMGKNYVYGTDFEIAMFITLFERRVKLFKLESGELKCISTLDPIENDPVESETVNLLFTGNRRAGHFQILEFHEVPTENLSIHKVDVSTEGIANVSQKMTVHESATTTVTTDKHTLAALNDDPDTNNNNLLSTENRPAGHFATTISGSPVEDVLMHSTSEVDPYTVNVVDEMNCHNHEMTATTITTATYTTTTATTTTTITDVYSFTDYDLNYDKYCQDDMNHYDGCEMSTDVGLPNFDRIGDSSISELTPLENNYKVRKTNVCDPKDESSEVNVMEHTEHSEGTSSDQSIENRLGKNKKRTKNRYHHSIGMITALTDTVATKDGYLSDNLIREKLTTLMVDEFHCSCPLGFYGGVRANQEGFVAYANCRIASHKAAFRFDIFEIDTHVIEIHVSSDSQIPFKHTLSKTKSFRPLRGSKRKEMKKFVTIQIARTTENKTMTNNVTIEVNSYGVEATYTVRGEDNRFRSLSSLQDVEVTRRVFVLCSINPHYIQVFIRTYQIHYLTLNLKFE